MAGTLAQLQVNNIPDNRVAGKQLDIGSLKKKIQRHLGDGLVVVVGSGLSCAEGMPGMKDLAAHLASVVPGRITQPNDQKIWGDVSPLLSSGLEAALLKYPPSDNLEAVIMQSTAEFILPYERKIISEVVNGTRRLKFSHLLDHLLKPTSGIPVITTNYDRLLEIASEDAGLGVECMFVGNYLASLSEEECRMNYCKQVSLKGRIVHYYFRERVKLYKPHGSLDWYQRNGIPVRLHHDLDLPRLIITPGLNKFRNGYNAPFDKHRDRANTAIDNASRFLIIGYGFNDDHLETHLAPRILEGKPTILITKKISPNAEKLIKQSQNFIGLEESTVGSGGTRMLSHDQDIIFQNTNIWDLGLLVKEVLTP